MKQKTKKALTLIEIMVTVVILLIVIGSILYTFVHSMILNERNGNLATAYNDAQYVMEEIKALAFDNICTYISSASYPALANLYNEAISAACDTCCAPGASLTQITVTVSWTERQRNRSEQLSTAIARSVQ